MKAWLQKLLINLFVRHLFNFITEEDVLGMRGRDIYFQGSKLSKDVVKKLAADAKSWKGSLLWQVLSNEIKFQANKRMFEQSRSVEDIIAGKMALYNMEVIEKKLDQLSSL